MLSHLIWNEGGRRLSGDSSKGMAGKAGSVEGKRNKQGELSSFVPVIGLSFSRGGTDQ